MDAEQLFRQVSNWGRWGPDDELGTLNHIKSETVVAAARLVRTGRVVSIGRDLDYVASPDNPRPSVHRMLYTRPISTADEITVASHSFHVTHLDAVAHCSFQEQVYGGRSIAETALPDGLGFGSIMAQANGIVTRGVMLDVARSRGVAWLSTDESVTVADLEAAEEMDGVRVGTGDALFVRVGLLPRQAAEPAGDPWVRAGLANECLVWLHEREVAVYGGDCIEKLPSPDGEDDLPLHTIGLSAMGLALLDWPDVEPLARACAEEERWEFMLVATPLRIPRGTGSPVNPVCLF